jgi:hypothetical protein
MSPIDTERAGQAGQAGRVLDPRKFVPTPLDLLGALCENYAEYEAPREDRTSIKVYQFPSMVTTALETMKEHSDKGNGRHASDGAALACCAAHGMEALLNHPVALDNIQFTSDLNLLKDCDLAAHEIIASQFRDFAVTLSVPGGSSKERSVWLPGQIAKNVLNLAHDMGTKPGQLLMVAVISALSTQQEFLSNERCRALARAVGDYMKRYSFRGRFGLAALKVAKEIESDPDSDPDSWD